MTSYSQRHRIAPDRPAVGRPDPRLYYAVLVGRKPGIYRTWWDGAEPQVHRFSGAKHKRFDTLEAAQAFMRQATI